MPTIKINDCDFDCYSKDLGKGRGRGFRVYCRKVDKKCQLTVTSRKKGMPKQYWEMTISEFMDAYDLKTHDKIYALAMWCTSDEKPKLPKFVEGHNIVEAEIIKIHPKGTVADIRCGLIVNKDIKPSVARKMIGRIGKIPLTEASYGAKHDEFIQKALDEGKPVPQHILKEMLKYENTR